MPVSVTLYPQDKSSVTEDQTNEDGWGDSAVDWPRGTLVGRFIVLTLLGAGSMGVVYAAYDPELDRKVALKILQICSTNEPTAHARLLREAVALARLNHPNVVTIHDVGTFSGRVWIAMEHIDGQTLRSWIRSPEWDWLAALKIMLSAGRGLAAAHAVGLVHRDFKPDNIMIGRDGRVRVMDFGLAREVGRPDGQHAAEIMATETTLNAVLTRAGAVAGTPAYMAPELWTGERASTSSDQFSYCVTLWESLYGQRPFSGLNTPELAMNIVHGVIIQPEAASRTLLHNPTLRGLHPILLRGLSLDAVARWQSLEALLEEIERRTRYLHDPELDLAAAKPQRIKLAASATLGILTAWLVLQVVSPGQMPGPVYNLVASIGMTLLLIIGVLIFRKQLLCNTINRRVVAWLVISGLAMVFHRSVALFVAVPADIVVMSDLVMLAALAALAALVIDRWIAWASLLMLTGAVACAALPAVAQIVTSVSLVGVFLLAIRFWSLNSQIQPDL